MSSSKLTDYEMQLADDGGIRIYMDFAPGTSAEEQAEISLEVARLTEEMLNALHPGCGFRLTSLVVTDDEEGSDG